MLRSLTLALAMFVALPQLGAAKTAKDCNAEYAAQKETLRKQKVRKADFVRQCRAQPEGAAGSPAPAPSPAPQPSGKSQPAPAPAPRPSGTGTQFQAEAEAKSRCPGATVVWANTNSRIYHFAGNRNYGNTKSGAYMCESDAQAEGIRAPKNEAHP